MKKPAHFPRPVRAAFRISLIAVAGLIVALSLNLPVTAQQPADLFGGITFRDIGPTTQGGRFVDFAVVEATPRTFYAASASGGLWKTENRGLHWQSIFDDQPVISIGAVAVSQTNPDIVYVGSGEANNSRSSYSGDGVYKSTDAGATWTNVGLPDSRHIGRVIVHPTDPNTVYVAALGHLYSENEERGLYKTTDGGVTWTKSLAVQAAGKAIGVVDIVMHPTDPNTLYAAAYDKVRKPWTFGEGGPGSGIYKTTNAGQSWSRLERGLPTNPLGRIGLAIARTAPDTLYAVIENLGPADAARLARLAEGFGGGPEYLGAQMFRSDNAGGTWRQVAPAPQAPGGAAAGQGGRGGGPNLGNPPYYYAQVRVDPNDKEHLFVLSSGWSQSLDGGTTWQGMGFGGDNHALWINPKDTNHMLLGYDHGLGVTFDGGENWFTPDNMPLAQFYAVSYDMEVPYNVYGGIQDNGSAKGPSTMRGGGSIPFEAWYRVGGGDGMYNVVDWSDSRWLYNESQFGPLQRVDQRTGQSEGIRYNRAQGQDPLRFNWNAPILVSQHDPSVIYHGANVLLRSASRGDGFEEISPDLTKNDETRQGGSGNIQYATITTIDESPIVAGLLYAGTDDGNLQMTRDGGENWIDVTDRLPGHAGYWISRIEASNHDPAVADVTATGYRRDDFRPFVWKTTDYGATWSSIAANLPNEPVNVIREDHKNPNLLFVGTEPGLYVSIDGGRVWHDLQNNLPTNAVYDLQIHPRDNELIVGTHGRSMYIADITGLQGLTSEVMAAGAGLMDVQPEILWVTGQRPTGAAINFNGQSRPTGASIHYYLASAAGAAKVQIYDGARMIAEVEGPASAGVNTVRWNLQASREAIPGEAVGRGGRGGRGGFGGRGGRGGGAAAVPVFPTGSGVQTPVKPGSYRVVLTVAGQTFEKPAVVLEDLWYR